MIGFVKLTLWNFETNEWMESNVRSTDIVRVTTATDAARRVAEGAGSEMAVMSGGAILVREGPELVLTRMRDAGGAR